MIKNIVFDFGKVLVDYDFMFLIDTFFEDEDEKRGFCKIFLDQSFIDECDRELVPFKQIIENAKAKHPEYSEALQKFYDRYPDFVTGEVPGMREELTWLKSQGYKLYGLTNWCSAVYQVMARFPEIFSLLDGKIISSEEHVIKPEAAIYEVLSSRFDLIPDETVFTDDKIVNIEGAIACGLQGIQFHNARQFHADLLKLL